MDNQSSVRISILALSGACIALSFYISYSLWSAAKLDARSVFAEDSAELNYRLSSQLEDTVRIAINNAFLTANSPILSQTLASPDNTQMLQASWANMLKFTPTLYQIRYLNLEGDEVYRLERSGTAYQWVPADKLQNKRSRDYFIEGLAVDEAVYISSIDLNAELGKIEIPYRPTIRASAKVIEEGEVSGLVVLNFDLRAAFAFFEMQQSNLEHWIVKQNGYFLSAPTEQEWGWLLGNQEDNISTVFQGISIDQEAEYSYDEHWLSDTLFISVSDIHSPIEDVFVSENQFWIITVLPNSVANRLNALGLSILVVLTVVTLIIISVARYVDLLITKMRQSQQMAIDLADKAQASERSKASFLAQMSHEIRTPMNGLYGLLQLTSTEQDQKKIAHNIKNALRSFESLRRIIDDILDFSKIEAGKLTLLKQPFSLDVALSDIAQMMSRAAYGKNIDMWIDIDERCPRLVVGDFVRLNQILFNLTNNAIKFTEEGEISIQVKLLDETENTARLGFIVKDTGIGMSDQEGSQVFESFTQASDQTHIKFGGSGLGLSIVKQLIALMDGDISLESQPGKGSCFSFDISLNKVNETARFAEPDIRSKMLSLQTLIVTPSDTSKLALQKQVATLGWLSQSSKSLQGLNDSLQKLTDQSCLVLIDDLILADIRSLTILKALKEDYPQIILHLIASPSDQWKSAQVQSIFDIITHKPVTPSVLFDAYVSYSNSESPPPEKSPALLSAHNLSELKVLIVEDNEINQMVACSMLETAGAIVTLAANGQECLDLMNAGEQSFDAILMDMQMPVLGGIDTTVEIRKNPAFAHIPIIALTANAMEEERNECIAAGMQAHLAKPMERSELIQTLLKVMHEHAK